MAVTPNGAYVYVTNEGSDTVSVISTATNTVTATVTVGSGPNGVAVTPNGAYAYITNGGSDTVSVISTPSPSVSVLPSSWTMDVGQSTMFTAIPSGGSGAYSSYQWYVGGIAQGGQISSTFSYDPSTTGFPLITVTVTDGSGEISVQSTAPSVIVNSSLVAPTASASVGTVDQGQTSSLTSTAVATGTSPYTYQWLVKAPNAGSYSTINGATSSAYSFVTSGSTAAGAWSFELQVADSASNPATATSTAASVTVNAAPTVSIAPVGPLTLSVGQVQAFTATASGGSGSLSYQWYLDGAAVGSNSASYSYTAAGTSHSLTCKVTDSASTPVTSPASTAVSVTVNPAPTPTPTPSPTTQPTSVTSAAPTSVPNASPTPIPTRTPTSVPNASPTPTVTPTATPAASGSSSIAWIVVAIVIITVLILVFLMWYTRLRRPRT